MHNVYLIISIFGLILAISLFTKKSVNRNSTFFLGLFYIIYSIYALQTYIIIGGLLLEYSWFYVWPLPIYNLIAVPIFFYFLTLIKDEFVWRWKYLILFVPFIIGVIDVSNIYTQPQAVYDTIISNAHERPAERFDVRYGFLNINQHYTMRHLWQALSLISLLPLLRNFIRNLFKEKDRKLIIWVIGLYVLLILMSLLMITFGLERMLNSDFLGSSRATLRTVNLVFYLVLFAIGIIPIYFPFVLYGYPRTIKSKSGLKVSQNSDEELKFGLDTEVLESKLGLLKEQGLFSKQGFNLTQCAQGLEIPVHHLSYFLNRYHGVSFSEYRNKMRIENAKTLINQGYLKLNTMEALAQQSGFANRSSFSKTFKKFTSMSVTQFASNS